MVHSLLKEFFSVVTEGDGKTAPAVDEETSWKRPLGKRCSHGLSVFEVDGTHVRNHLDSDFDQGGNGFAYKFVPKDEIWVDSSVPEAERPYVIFHECNEFELMEILASVAIKGLASARSST